MLGYYTSLIALCWAALLVLCILVWENSWIPGEDKRRFYLTYAIIALSAFAECLGLHLSGNTAVPKWVLSAVKCVDYILTPLAGGALVTQIKLHDRWRKALMGVLVGNAVFQLLCLFTGWMVVIDDGHRYTHGPLYPIYIVVYFAVIVLTGAEFLAYGSGYMRRNRVSLYSVLLLVVVSILIQEVLGGEFRTAYVGLTMGATLMFIHYSEFYQMSADAHIRKQRKELMKDALSGAYSRYAYNKDLERYSKMAWVPDNYAAFTIDINGLKATNDTIGHDAGDELIIGAARCIEKAFGGAGRCYRTGGDEFVVLAQMGKDEASAVLDRLEHDAAAWTGVEAKHLSLSAGCALSSDYPDLELAALIKKADQAMYAAKAEYYRKGGHDRRSR